MQTNVGLVLRDRTMRREAAELGNFKILSITCYTKFKKTKLLEVKNMGDVGEDILKEVSIEL
jgi:hypothetical protein